MKKVFAILLLVVISNVQSSYLFASWTDFLPALYMISHTEKKHLKNKNFDTIPARKGAKRFMIIQRAPKGSLTKTEDGRYMLTLDEVDDFVLFYKVQPNRNFGMISLRQFMWYVSLGKSLFNKDGPRGAMSYLSFQPCKDAPAVHSEVFDLNKPQYDKKKNVLYYEAAPLHGFEIQEGTYTDMTLIIDLAIK